MSQAKTGGPTPMRKGNTIILACMFVFFAVLLVMSQALGGTAGQVPRLMSGIGLILTVIEAFAQLRELGGEVQEQDAVEPAVGLRWYYSLVALLSYIAILMPFGFVASTAVYLFLFPVVMGYRKWRVNLVFALVSTVILYFGFVQLFMVQLPEGTITASLLRGL